MAFRHRVRPRLRALALATDLGQQPASTASENDGRPPVCRCTLARVGICPPQARLGGVQDEVVTWIERGGDGVPHECGKVGEKVFESAIRSRAVGFFGDGGGRVAFWRRR